MKKYIFGIIFILIIILVIIIFIIKINSNNNEPIHNELIDWSKIVVNNADRQIKQNNTFIDTHKDLSNDTKKIIIDNNNTIQDLIIANKKLSDAYEKELKKRFSLIRMGLILGCSYTLLKDLEFNNIAQNKIKVNGKIGFGILIAQWGFIGASIQAPDIAFELSGIIFLNK